MVSRFWNGVLDTSRMGLRPTYFIWSKGEQGGFQQRSDPRAGRVLMARPLFVHFLGTLKLTHPLCYFYSIMSKNLKKAFFNLKASNPLVKKHAFNSFHNIKVKAFFANKTGYFSTYFQLNKYLSNVHKKN